MASSWSVACGACRRIACWPTSARRTSPAGVSARSIVVQPLGAIEQHGPHLPLHTDLLVADAVAAAAVERVGDEVDAWLLPALAYTKSNEHAWAPGTVWLSATTLLAVLDDIGRCVAMTPAERLVFLNGHGGNSALRQRRQPRAAPPPRADDVPRPPGRAAGPGRRLGARTSSAWACTAGTDETSLVLHLAPELVDMSQAARATCPSTSPPTATSASAARCRSAGCRTTSATSGVIGDPVPATAERGAALFDAAVDAFCERAARDRHVHTATGRSAPVSDGRQPRRLHGLRDRGRGTGGCGRGSWSSGRSGRSRGRTASRGAPAWPSPTPIARVATSSSGGCATSASP